MLKIYLLIYIVVYVSWYIINKVFDGKPDKYLRAKIWNFIETQYGFVVPEDLKSNPLKYFVNDLKITWHKLKGGNKNKKE